MKRNTNITRDTIPMTGRIMSMGKVLGGRGGATGACALPVGPELATWGGKGFIKIGCLSRRSRGMARVTIKRRYQALSWLSITIA